MPTIRIYPSTPDKPCMNWDHTPPPREQLKPGLWRHTCPACDWVTTIAIPEPE